MIINPLNTTREVYSAAIGERIDIAAKVRKMGLPAHLAHAVECRQIGANPRSCALDDQ